MILNEIGTMYELILSKEQFDNLETHDYDKVCSIMEQHGGWDVDYHRSYGTNIGFTCKSSNINAVVLAFEKLTKI